MSLRENLQLYHQLDVDQYLAVLERDYQSHPHPDKSDCFLVGSPELPFYRPKAVKDHISILGFNYLPLPGDLLQALINHPELAPDTSLICWTCEQDLILEDTLGELRRQANSYDTQGTA